MRLRMDKKEYKNIFDPVKTHTGKIFSRKRGMILTRLRAPDGTVSSVASSLRGAKRNKIISAPLMLLSLTLSGCMGVTRLPARVRTPQGWQKPLAIRSLRTD